MLVPFFKGKITNKGFNVCSQKQTIMTTKLTKTSIKNKTSDNNINEEIGAAHNFVIGHNN